MSGLKEKAYQVIKNNILTCRYAPGDLLNESQLIEEIGASRTPIREALSRLEQERFVKILPKKGIIVSDLTLKEISDIYQVRMLMEPQLILTWGSSIPIEELEKCRSALLSYSPDMDLLKRNELDDSLHRLICASCSNSYIHEWMSHLFSQNERIRIITGQIGQRMELNNEGHLKILRSLLISDYEGASRLMAEHLEEARRSTFDALLHAER